MSNLSYSRAITDELIKQIRIRNELIKTHGKHHISVKKATFIIEKLSEKKK